MESLCDQASNMDLLTVLVYTGARIEIVPLTEFDAIGIKIFQDGEKDSVVHCIATTMGEAMQKVRESSTLRNKFKDLDASVFDQYLEGK